MPTTNAPTATPLPFRQPKPWIRWLAVILAAAGWYLSLQLLRVSAGDRRANPFLQAVCGEAKGVGEVDGCTSVLTSPQAYFQLGKDPNSPRIPVSIFGMAYFAFVGLWYLFIGPPAQTGRIWHLLLAAIVLCGVWQSLAYIGIMKYVLHRWCGGCLVVHALNGALLLLTLLAYPWQKPAQPTAPHPTARLTLATITAGGLAFITHLAIIYVVIAGTILKERTDAYAAVLDDPEFIVWDFERQAVVSIPLFEDECFSGSPTAPNTAVVFSDFQCTHCRRVHQVVADALAKHSDRLRVAYRYYPQDPECNPNPKFRTGAHACACRAARAAQAARLTGGPEAYERMRTLLYERQSELPTVPYAQQTEEQRRLLEDWAVELGLNRAAFAQAIESPAVAARIQADIDLAERLGISAMPVVYVNGKRLRNWSKLETWDAVLGGESTATTQPTSAPAAP